MSKTPARLLADLSIPFRDPSAEGLEVNDMNLLSLSKDWLQSFIESFLFVLLAMFVRRSNISFRIERKLNSEVGWGLFRSISSSDTAPSLVCILAVSCSNLE